MPIVEADPWRSQYFTSIRCPDDVIIPTDDELGYELYPQHRWIYNKLLICETQGLEHAPHGIIPKRFPVFSKPIYNLRGMGSGGKIIASAAQLKAELLPGHMWMTLLAGEQVSSDAVVIRGEPAWWRHTIAKPLGHGMFDYWTVLSERRPEIELYCGSWIRRHLKDYTGCINLESIGGKIIETALRFADQWPDLYGPGWIEAVVELYTKGHWRFADEARHTGYSVVLFGRHGPYYRHPDRLLVDKCRRQPGISSIQITFHDDRPPEMHPMPPGGFRLAIINCWEFETGLKVREQLAHMFTQSSLPTQTASIQQADSNP
jgi:hypothetical protein